MRRIDHVVVEAGDEQALFDFLTTALGLPTAWPMAEWGLIHEAGVGLGNCNIGCNHPLDPNSDPAPAVRAIAFEPTTNVGDVVAELQRRGLSPTEPMASGRIDVPDEEPFLPWQRGWTNVLVLGGPADPLPFVCAYDHDVASRAHDERARFDAAGGGRLAITGLRAVIVHTDDVDREAASWAALLRPALSDRPGVFELASGPELRIEPGAGPPALLLGVSSMTTAVEALDSLGIGHEDRAGVVRLQPADTMGLDLRLIQGR